MFTEKEIEVSDSVRLRYYVHQSPSASNSWIVLCNGIGASTRAWKGIIQQFSQQHSILFWEYRALNGSKVDISIERHALDLKEILHFEKY